MTSRSKFHVGRAVLYNPTVAEAAASGAGPWAGEITLVNATGTCNLSVAIPAGTIAAKTAVPQGSRPGSFTFQAGSSAV